MKRLTLSRNRCTFFRDGVVISFRCRPLWYLRRCCPRKLTPSSIEVMSVFSVERVRPRSLKKVLNFRHHPVGQYDLLSCDDEKVVGVPDEMRSVRGCRLPDGLF